LAVSGRLDEVFSQFLKLRVYFRSSTQVV